LCSPWRAGTWVLSVPSWPLKCHGGAGYLSYAGPFTVVNDGLIAHHVEVGLLPNWIGGIQYRKARLRDSCLELSSAEPMLMAGQPRIAKLVWARA
jgi:hypothetical protein